MSARPFPRRGLHAPLWSIGVMGAAWLAAGVVIALAAWIAWGSAVGGTR